MKLISRVACAAMAFGLAFSILSSAAADEAKPKEIKPIKQWTGRILEGAQKEAPKRGYITSEKVLANLWKEWKVKDEMPKVDFEKEIVLVSSSRSSGLAISLKLNEKGDLTLLGIATADLAPDYKFVLQQVNREGIKTIMGKAIENE